MVNSSIPYNGTVFNLTGVILLDRNIIDSDVIAIWVWSYDGAILERLETRSQPYSASLVFEPLATNSSGEYSLAVTIQSSDRSDYIVANSGSIVFSLMVLRKLFII